MQKKPYHLNSSNSSMRLAFLLLVISVCSCKNFFKTALNDFDPQSFYIVINVTDTDESFSAVLENSTLYSLLNKGVNLSQDEYISLVYPVIKSHMSLEVTSEILDTLKPYQLVSNPAIDSLFKGDVQNILNEYFDSGIQSKELSNEDLKSVVYYLFREKILVKTDDESGLLYIEL